MSDPLDDYAEMTKMWITFHAARPDVELSWFLQHYKDGALLPPVEPPVLSRASIDELIDAYFSRQQFISQQIAGGVRHGMIALRDAILESLSQEDS